MKVRIDWDIVTAPPIEEQLNSQGATLGRIANQIQDSLKYCECLYVWGYLTQSEATRANERIYKAVKENIRLLEPEAENDNN